MNQDPPVIRLQRILHRGELRIRLDFPFTTDFVERVKQIPGRRWSQSKRCWHIPYQNATYVQLKALFFDIPIILPDTKEDNLSGTNGPSTENNETTAPPDTQSQVRPPDESHSVKLVITPQKLFLYLPHSPAAVEFIRSLRYARWNYTSYRWEISSGEQNLNALRAYFGDKLTEETLEAPQILSSTSKKNSIGAKKLDVFAVEKLGRLRLLSQYDASLIALIKTLPYPRYHADNKWWSVADTPKVRADLEQFCQDHTWKIRYSKERQASKPVARVSAADVPQYKKCPIAFINQLKIKRYSPNTVRTYTNLFEEFINW